MVAQTVMVVQFDFVIDSNPRVIRVRKPSATHAIRAHDLALATCRGVRTFGFFKVHHPLNSLQVSVMNRMEIFYTEEHLRVLCQLVDQTSTVSLRTMDWLVTSYAKSHEIFTSADRQYNMHDHYKLFLAKYKRRNFDPFRRSKRKVGGINVQYDVSFVHGGVDYHTTVGQLNFVAWSLRNDVYKVAVENKGAIDEAMAHALRAKRSLVATPRSGQTSYKLVSAFQVEHTVALV
uniref:Uncharacterized protein n=1 Tax=viral metagenome TaxID=1070528 RepID=A0A6C0KCD3_9ZZZZ